MGCHTSTSVRGLGSRSSRKKALKARRTNVTVDDDKDVSSSVVKPSPSESVRRRNPEFRYYKISKQVDPPPFKINQSLMLQSASDALVGIELGGYVREIDGVPVRNINDFFRLIQKNDFEIGCQPLLPHVQKIDREEGETIPIYYQPETMAMESWNNDDNSSCKIIKAVNGLPVQTRREFEEIIQSEEKCFISLIASGDDYLPLRDLEKMTLEAYHSGKFINNVLEEDLKKLESARLRLRKLMDKFKSSDPHT